MQVTQFIPQQVDYSKSTLDSIAKELSDLVKDGHLYALETDVKLKAMQEVIERVRKEIRPNVLNEITRNGTKEFNGVAVKENSGRTTLDYDSDAEYSILKSRLSARKEILDAAYKASQKGIMVFYDKDSAEVFAPEVKSVGENSVSYTFKK